MRNAFIAAAEKVGALTCCLRNTGADRPLPCGKGSGPLGAPLLCEPGGAARWPGSWQTAGVEIIVDDFRRLAPPRPPV